MTAASSLPYPSSRTLAGWWKQIAPLDPQSWWVGHLLVHRVEAAVQVDESQPLPPLTQILLQALHVSSSQGEAKLAELESALGLPSALLRPLLRELSQDSFVNSEGMEGWRLTEAGRAALMMGQSRASLCRRQTFSFAEQRTPTGERLGTPTYLALASTPLARTGMSHNFPFDVAWLETCVRQGEDWKSAHAFPEGVKRLLRFEDNHEEEFPAWKRVVLAHMEEVTITLVKTGEGLKGFAVAPSDWSLDLTQPVLHVPTETEGLLNEEEASTAKQAWIAWAKLRNLPLAEVEACRLAVEGCVLRIHGSQRLFDALTKIKSDLLKGDAWVLLGEGFVRRAMRLEFAVV